MKTNSTKANVLIAVMLGLGSLITVRALLHWQSENPARFICYSVLALMSSGMKVKLPSIDGSMSVVFMFTLIGIGELSFAETLAMIIGATLIQCFWHAEHRPRPVQIVFNLSSIAVAIWACSTVYNLPFLLQLHVGTSLRLCFASAVYFLFNTFPVAMVICFTENKSIRKVWHECYFWSFPYYLVGAGIAGIFGFLNRWFGWETMVLVVPIVFMIYRSYRLYLSKLTEETRRAQEQRKHAEDIASLHLRTIEALALAIEAKDHTTHDHLRRVQVYAVEIGKEMGLSEPELGALRAAALLHDIGKLAVPEHIISKPGRLTQEEFEKMKIHPIVGAEILEQVKFPYPVVPIVRAHHEKWNGNGYPYGLRGEEIPIGARILAAVDCLDAIASERQYRRALPLDLAMEVVISESGKSYDPKVVEILQRRYRELEGKAKEAPINGLPRLSTAIRIENGNAPAVGLETGDTPSGTGSSRQSDFLHSIAAARQEVQALFEMSQDLGNSLSLTDTLSVLAIKLKRIIPHDSIAIYLERDRKLIPEFVAGLEHRLFGSLQIPVGQGLSGWVADNRKAIVNGNPSVEPSYLNDPTQTCTLRSALAVPLEGLTRPLGVLTLYRLEKDAFTRDHLRILKALSSKVSLSIENALRFRQAENSATTDFLTGLPNARSLFLHLHQELERCNGLGIPLTVVVCDLDGFKQVNDRFGHLEGNRVLQAVGQGLRSICRESDYVARMGGDEFVVVLPGLQEGDLESKIDRLCRMVATVGASICGENIVSLSAGAAFSAPDMTEEQMLAVADRRMYEMKQAHRAKPHGRALVTNRASLTIQ
jgi:diguanylate cyclase (GGDEF)-like protein/putative nucleotidyltransferase with HDIG domain